MAVLRCHHGGVKIATGLIRSLIGKMLLVGSAEATDSALAELEFIASGEDRLDNIYLPIALLMVHHIFLLNFCPLQFLISYIGAGGFLQQLDFGALEGRVGSCFCLCNQKSGTV